MAMNRATMAARDAVSGKLADCFITISGKRYNFMQATNLETSFEKTKTEVAILGRTMPGNKATGGKGKGKATFHYNTSIFRKVMEHYKDTGEDIYFDMQVTNEDPTSRAGRQTTIYLDCNIDSVILAKFDAKDDVLSEEMEFTFEDFKIAEEFKTLEGML